MPRKLDDDYNTVRFISAHLNDRFATSWAEFCVAEELGGTFFMKTIKRQLSSHK